MKVMIWGTGEMAAEFTDMLEGESIVCYIESVKTKEVFNGYPVILPEEIGQYEYDWIFIANRYVRDIMNRCIAAGVAPEKLQPILPVLNLNIEFMDQWLRLKTFVNERFWEKLVTQSLPGYLNEIIQQYMNQTVNPIIFEQRYKYEKSPEIARIRENVRRNKRLSMYNYDFAVQSPGQEVKALLDESLGMHYIPRGTDRMYFPRYWPKERVEKYYYDVCIVEQKAGSPHSYTREGFQVQKGDCIVDAGAAEGDFTLNVIHQVKKAYLIECDERWLEALSYTFRPYKDKVEIIERFLCDYDDEKHITLDKLRETKEFHYVKMDIEGAETAALKGAEKVLQRGNVRWAICTYHRLEDYHIIHNCLRAAGCQIELQPGWLYVPQTTFDVELKRGVLFGRRDG